MHSPLRLALALMTTLALAAVPAIAEEPPGPVPLRVGGFAQVTWATSSASTADSLIGVLDPLRRNTWALDAVQIAIERPVRIDHLESGFVVRAMAGSGVTPLRAAGLDLGDQGDLTQAYVVLNVPTTTGAVQFSAGRMATMLGYEVIESPANPDVSFGNQYVFVENFTHLGADVNWIVNPKWSVRACIHNGWDLVRDNNRVPSYMARVGWTPDATTTIALLGYAGPEQAGNADDLRSGGELLVTRAFGSVTTALQLDAGGEQGIDAAWSAAGLWVAFPLASRARLALRADYLDDADGARTSGALGFPAHAGLQIATVTATLDVQPVAGFRVRPELRWDHASLDVFGGKADQVAGTLGVSMAF